MDGPFPARKRRRLIEAFLAAIVLCGISAVLLGQGHRPLVLSGGLLARDIQGH